MAHKTVKKITTIDGHVIQLHIFTPTDVAYQESNCDGVILAVHGLAEHSGRYSHLAEFACKKNKIFVIFDLRGHGDNALKKGNLQNFHCLVLDIIFALNTLKSLFTSVKKDSFGLFGHSYGGLLVTYSASILRHEIKKIFLSAPGYALRQEVSPWKILLANNTSRLFPELRIPFGFNANNISNNPLNNEACEKDPLILKHVTVHCGKILLDSIDKVRLKTAIQSVTAEVTMVLPSDDKIVVTSFTKQILSSFQTTVNVHEIEGAGHESFNEEKDKQEIAFSLFEKWINKL